MSEAADAALVDAVARTFTATPFDHVGVAVSGGGDSVALLLLMQDWAARSGARLSAVTFDHGLRAEAPQEAAMVARLCRERGIAHDILTWAGWNGQGNLQASARMARYREIAQWARQRGVEAVGLGHTCDDQAETFVMRLARKAGSDGLRRMASRFERYGMEWVRPLLGVERSMLRRYLERQGVGWVEDPSNADDGFERVRVRKALEVLAPLGIDAQVLGAVAENLASENSLLRQTVQQALHGKVVERCGALSLSHDDFQALHSEVRRRFLNAALQWISGAQYSPRSTAQGGFEAVLLGRGTQTLGGVIGWVAQDRVWLAREYQAVMDLHGSPFDGRWQIEGPLDGMDIRALGAEGLQQCPDWRDLGLPRRVLLSLPAVWDAGRLVWSPVSTAETRHKAVRIGPSFENWLCRD
ncbi:tRNA lysidine(34) synthetase TilS [Aquicoccus porphyridii]|uniref:tRNA lysidine(34) synthetase TilS n=1 Tax=Aquicoccus porphyridii TaxID=1852029 RepID=UPI00165DE14C|nr:tRNA lysidine(34) synthetase TilS [Aquicoccus porphyridii]